MSEGRSESNRRRGRVMDRSNSRRFLPCWGKPRLEIVTWLAFLLILFQLLDHTTLVGGFPLDVVDDEISQAAARAVVAAAMGSDGSGIPRHHHRGNEMMKVGESQDQDRDRDVEASPPRLAAVELLLHKAATAAAAKTAEEEELKMMEREEEEEENLQERKTGRALWSDEFQRRASELCRTSATLQCGRRILTLTRGQEKDLSVHMKCDLRDDFLKCIDREKNDCLELAESSILPELPPKEMIKVEQSKLWDVLWTAGGCILST